MGASNQEMVNEIHLNRRGFKGDGIAYFFKPMRYLHITRIIERVRSVRKLNSLIINQLDDFHKALPPIAPPNKINPLLSLILMKTLYGFSNRIVTFEGVIAIRTSVIGPLSPPPSAAPLQTSTKIFFRKRPCTNERHR